VVKLASSMNPLGGSAHITTVHPQKASNHSCEIIDKNYARDGAGALLFAFFLR
jgi:hypothetical protein